MSRESMSVTVMLVAVILSCIGPGLQPRDASIFAQIAATRQKLKLAIVPKHALNP